MTADFQERREALANDDLMGRADLMAEDAGNAMIRTLFSLDDLKASEDAIRFCDRLLAELRAALRADADMIFLTEATTREETREAVEVACDASQRAMARALDKAEAAFPLPRSKQAAFAELRKRARDEGMDSAEMVAEREAWLDSLPTCAGCGK